MYYSGTNQCQKPIHSPLVLLAEASGVLAANVATEASVELRPKSQASGYQRETFEFTAALTSEPEAIRKTSGFFQPQMKGRVVAGFPHVLSRSSCDQRGNLEVRNGCQGLARSPECTSCLDIRVWALPCACCL